MPNLDALRAWSTQEGRSFATDEALVASPEAGDKIEREIRKDLRDLAQFEMPKKVVLIARDFSIESGELTPTLKVKRRIVEKNYKSKIDAVYAEPKGGSHDV